LTSQPEHAVGDDLKALPLEVELLHHHSAGEVHKPHGHQAGRSAVLSEEDLPIPTGIPIVPDDEDPSSRKATRVRAASAAATAAAGWASVGRAPLELPNVGLGLTIFWNPGPLELALAGSPVADVAHI